jgi:hypothetical protein
MRSFYVSTSNRRFEEGFVYPKRANANHATIENRFKF